MEQSAVQAFHHSAGNRATVSKLSGKRGRGRTGGVVVMKPEVITADISDLSLIAQRLNVAHLAIMSEVDRAISAVAGGHALGFAAFSSWYRSYAKAQENASTQLAASVFGFVLKQGLKIIFPEEEVFFEILRTVAEFAYDKLKDSLGEVPSGDVNMYLASLALVEAKAVILLLDSRERFQKEQKLLLDDAKWEFLSAQDKGWIPAPGAELPQGVLNILHSAGVGSHGASAATVFAERWLTAHIEAIYLADERSQGIMGTSGDVAVFAKVAALRKLDPVANRERIFEIEKSVPFFFRTVTDINEASAYMLHLRFDIDLDDAEEIVASRERSGRFNDPQDLVARGMISDEKYKKLAPYIVAQ
jgi:hypothetical protein